MGLATAGEGPETRESGGEGDQALLELSERDGRRPGMPAVEHQLYLWVLLLQESKGRCRQWDHFQHNVLHVSLLFAEQPEETVDELESLRLGKKPCGVLAASVPENHRLRKEPRFRKSLQHLNNGRRVCDLLDTCPRIVDPQRMVMWMMVTVRSSLVGSPASSAREGKCSRGRSRRNLAEVKAPSQRKGLTLLEAART